MDLQTKNKRIADFLEYMSELNPESCFPTGVEDAIIRYVERFGQDPLILLDRSKCLEILMRDGISLGEAQEWMDFNVLGAWMVYR